MVRTQEEAKQIESAIEEERSTEIRRKNFFVIPFYLQPVPVHSANCV
jgi:hypothetical protein